jgi:hypothetical protein
MPEPPEAEYILFQYDKGAIRDLSFEGWQRLGRTSKVTPGETLLYTAPTPIHGHVIAFGILLTGSPMPHNVGNVMFDFSTRTMRDVPVDVGSVAGGNEMVAWVEEHPGEREHKATLIVAK